MAVFSASRVGSVRWVSEIETVSFLVQIAFPSRSDADSSPSATASACQSFIPYMAAAIGAVITNAVKDIF